ncbi:MAG: enoyl-CoA hydratase/isomerase family protein [Dehalococcoidia bacterium]
MESAEQSPPGVVILGLEAQQQSPPAQRCREVSTGKDVRCIVLEAGADADGTGASQLVRLRVPVIFVVGGTVEGGALELALAADVRISAPEGAFEIPRPGSNPWLEARLARLGGEDVAPLRGRTVRAPRLLDIGLVSAIVPDPGEEALRLAGLIAARGPIAEELGKEALWRGLEMPLAQALRFETDLTLLLQTTKDRVEGVRAFIEKREPTFKGE